jgi:hypothetical protein
MGGSTHTSPNVSSWLKADLKPPETEVCLPSNIGHHSDTLPQVYRGWMTHVIRTTDMRILTLILLAMLLATPASARCLMSYCKDKAPSRSYITNNHRQKVGDLYSPGNGQRVQIRDTSRRIIGYIELDGSITNTRRQPVANIETLRD